jgi:hypothetical protein
MFQKILSWIGKTIKSWFSGNSKNNKAEAEYQAFLQRDTLCRQQQQIGFLHRKLASEQGEYTVANGERKYKIDEDQSRFEATRHRNLGGMVIQELKSFGLESNRTAERDPNGDVHYAPTRSSGDKAKMKAALERMQTRYNSTNKGK